ncbi:aminotransferase-like domain-containing protein [Planococcus salinarum]|uniref:aminotransferase-like domain-containing protein n=1 Tax=Planococcus salinarum TaxID=622695 RepID=UPI001E5F5082|nr:PLP-dependent aminotransferase family protein [Planococcus salinarum]
MMKPSDMRIILTAAEQPDLISFAGGLPAPELFPVEALKKASEAVFTEDGPVSLQYSPTEGYSPLRSKTLERMEEIGIQANLDQVMITSGSQQAIDLTGRLLLEEGDTVICESPTYLAALNVFNICNANIVDVEMDENGMLMEVLEQQLQENPDAKFIYTIPDFQNPTGRTLSLERRKRMLELAQQYDVLILEDNPYGAIRFSGTPILPIKHFDTEGRVIYMSSFSKILAPGLRLGWICADEVVIEKYRAFKESADMHSDGFAQRLTSKYMEQNDINEHIKKVNTAYLDRCNTMYSCVSQYFPEAVTCVKPEGGLFIWVELPDTIDARKISVACLEQGVAVLPGEAFFATESQSNALRLNFSNASEERIIEGMKRIGEVLHLELRTEAAVK